MKSREIHLVKRPSGMLDASCFKLVDNDVGETLGDGEVLIKNLWMSVDPYMRPRMNDVKSYIPPFALNAVLDGGAVGVVIASKNPKYPVGTGVESMHGWREYFVGDGKGLGIRNFANAKPEAYLGLLGMPGLTAYIGTKVLGKAQPGDTVYVSAAAGAVGSVACQIALAMGCTVVGSAGSDAKIDWLMQHAGVHAAFNYRHEPDYQAALQRLCPQGIDLYFDNVGGGALDATLTVMNHQGRIVCCGSIEDYNKTGAEQRGVKNLFHIIGKGLTMTGFIVFDYMDDYHKPFAADMGRWLAEGKLKVHETVYEGIEKAPEALMGLFTGANTGKMLVKLGELD